MMRVRLYLVGSLVLVALAGCGRSLFNFAQREPWRREAEVACLKSGVLKENPAAVRIEPIEGPGICGADFPLKVAALGNGSSLMSFADDPTPPGLIPRGRSVRSEPQWPVSEPPREQWQPAREQWPPPQTRRQPEPQWQPAPPQGPGSDIEATSAPLSIRAPGVDDPDEDVAAGAPEFDPAAPTFTPARRPYYSTPVTPPPATLGPPAGQRFTAAIGPVTVKPAATLACPIVSALDQWMTESVQPAAMRWFGQPVVAIKQISAYSCRGMNGNPNAHISEHAFGNALDIAAFTLADGHTISFVRGWHGTPEEQGFLHDVQGAACRRFTTVLAPGSNRFHYNHMHVDLMRRSSRRVICEPDAIPGAVAAARAARRGNYARHGGPMFTGSITSYADDARLRAPPDDEDMIAREGTR
jgi:hypothetical protein